MHLCTLGRFLAFWYIYHFVSLFFKKQTETKTNKSPHKSKISKLGELRESGIGVPCVGAMSANEDKSMGQAFGDVKSQDFPGLQTW